MNLNGIPTALESANEVGILPGACLDVLPGKRSVVPGRNAFNPESTHRVRCGHSIQVKTRAPRRVRDKDNGHIGRWFELVVLNSAGHAAGIRADDDFQS